MKSVWNQLEEQEKVACRADGVHVCQKMLTDIDAVVEVAKHVNSMALLAVAAVRRCVKKQQHLS